MCEIKNEFAFISVYGFALVFPISRFIFNETTHWANFKNRYF